MLNYTLFYNNRGIWLEPGCSYFLPVIQHETDLKCSSFVRMFLPRTRFSESQCSYFGIAEMSNT